MTPRKKAITTFNIFSSPSQIATANECPRPPILLCLANQVCSHFAGRVSEERASRTSGRSQILLYRRARSRGAGSRPAVCRLAEGRRVGRDRSGRKRRWNRSEEHTSELQS